MQDYFKVVVLPSNLIKSAWKKRNFFYSWSAFVHYKVRARLLTCAKQYDFKTKFKLVWTSTVQAQQVNKLLMLRLGGPGAT